MAVEVNETLRQNLVVLNASGLNSCACDYSNIHINTYFLFCSDFSLRFDSVFKTRTVRNLQECKRR